ERVLEYRVCHRFSNDWFQVGGGISQHGVIRETGFRLLQFYDVIVCSPPLSSKNTLVSGLPVNSHCSNEAHQLANRRAADEKDELVVSCLRRWLGHRPFHRVPQRLKTAAV